MADKKISIIVQAVTDAARRNLQGLNKDLNDLGDTSGTIAQRLKAQGETAEDVALTLKEFGFTADEVKQHLRGAGYEVDSMASSLDLVGTAATIAKGAIIAIGAAFAVAKLGQKAIEIADTAAATVALREGFQRLAAQSQVDSQLLLDALKEASRGTVSEYDLMKEANEAWYLGIARNTKQYVDLMKIAEGKSKDLGISTLEYWQRLNIAIASGYPVGLRNLGIVIDNEVAYRDWANIIGVAADELTDQEEIQARVNAVIADGTPALERWEEAERDATTVTQEFHAAAADLRAEIGERLLPILIPGIESMIAVMEGSEPALQRHATAVEDTAKSYDELYRRMSKVAEMQEYGGRWAREGTKDFQELGITTEGMVLANEALKKSYADIDMKMQDARRTTLEVGEAQQIATRTSEELTDAIDKASDIYDKYVRDVEEANYRFGRSVADANFRAAQAAENAAFRRYEIERNASQRYEDDVRKHSRTIQRQWQDLHDALSDIEYDYQQDRKDLLKRSPWWIRQALQKEFAERKRVAASGDSAALEAFDKALRERIRAIDPVYAQELDELEEQFDRKEVVEKREAGQARSRTEQDFREQNRITRRELGDQLEAWRFHAAQRRENERRAMDNLIADNAHRLQALYDNTNRRLAELDAIWKHWGLAHGANYIEKLQHVLSSYTPSLPAPGYEQYVGPYPFPTEPFAFQQGAWEIPRRMMGILDKGEMVVPAAPAERMREGGMTIEIGQLVVPGSFTPQQGRQFANDVVDALGPRIRKKSR